MRHELTIEIARPPKTVFPHLCSPASLVQWMEEMESCTPKQEGAPAGGHEYDLTLRGPNGPSGAIMRLTELDRNERLGFVIEGAGAPIEGHYILDASPGGTTLILTRDTVERTFGERWRATFQAKAVKARLEADLARLKALAESD